MAKEGQEAVAGTSKASPFDLSAFELENCTLEVRYPFALALWDRSGQLWTAVQEKWPDITPTFVEPRKTDFQVGKNRLTVEFELARITTVDPGKSLDQFFLDAKDFIPIVTKHLHVTTFKRVGFRLIYFKEFKDKAEAADAFLALGLVRVPEGKKFEIDVKPINPHYGLRWESEKKGVMLSARTETRQINVEPSPEAARLMKPIHKQIDGMVVDVDYYTVSSVDPAQLDPAEWMRHAAHLVSRDTRYLFGE